MGDILPIFVDAQQVGRALERADVQVVAVEEHPLDFARAHIPGALLIQMQDLMGVDPPAGGLLPADGTLAELFSETGLRNDAHIIAYDRAGDGQAARFLYTLDAVGHAAFSLLDGGIAAWQAAGFDVESGPPARVATNFKVARQPERIADRDWIEAHLDDDEVIFLDTRSADEYTGHDVRAARGGHIPGAVHLDWLDLKDEHGHLRPRAELKSLLEQHGIQQNQEIAAYCQTHVRSSYTYLVLKALGFDKVRGYPGAWSQWGNAEDTPVEAGANAGQ